MRRFLKPRIVVSACLNLEPVRYNGEYIKDEFVLRLKKYCEFIPVCPEVGIGLPVPREKIIVYKKGKKLGLYQPSKRVDLTDRMIRFSKRFLNSLPEIDGFLLKSKSPSCGVSGTCVYKHRGKRIYHSEGKGFFALKVIEKFPYLPVEDERRLKSRQIKEHFLVRVFAIADLRSLIENIKRVEELIKFHNRYRCLFMSHSKSKLKQMEKIIADCEEKKNLEAILKKYRELFLSVLKNKPSKTGHMNVFQHIFKYFSDRLNAEEKGHFIELLEKYRKGIVEVKFLKEFIISFAHRFDDKYMINQVYLNPYPESLA